MYSIELVTKWMKIVKINNSLINWNNINVFSLNPFVNNVVKLMNAERVCRSKCSVCIIYFYTILTDILSKNCMYVGRRLCGAFISFYK